MDWWGQVEKSADQHHNTPVLFIHQDGMGAEDWLVVMHCEDWLDLVKGEKEADTSYTDPKLKWAVKNAVEANKKLLKLIDK